MVWPVPGGLSGGSAMLRRRLVLTGLAVSVVGARAWAVCPALQPPTFYAYRSDAATVELVVVNTTLAGIDHWSVSRTETGGSPVLLFPNRLSPSTTSITDQGQGLQAGHSYSYTLTATDVNSMQTSYTAAAHDVGNRVDHSLNFGVERFARTDNLAQRRHVSHDLSVDYRSAVPQVHRIGTPSGDECRARVRHCDGQ